MARTPLRGEQVHNSRIERQVMCGIGCSIMDQGLFGALAYFSKLHGPAVLLYMNAASRLTALPVLLLSHRWD